MTKIVNCETIVKSFNHSVTFRPRFCRSFGENFYNNGVRNRQFGHYFSQIRGLYDSCLRFSSTRSLKILTSLRKTVNQCTLYPSILTLLRILFLQEHLTLSKVPSRAHRAGAQRRRDDHSNHFVTEKSPWRTINRW